MVDWNQFGLEMLSGVIILGLGWVIAWILVHRIQNENMKKQIKNQMISDIEVMILTIDETSKVWLDWMSNKKIEDLWFKARYKAFNMINKLQILDVKIRN